MCYPVLLPRPCLQIMSDCPNGSKIIHSVAKINSGAASQMHSGVFCDQKSAFTVNCTRTRQHRKCSSHHCAHKKKPNVKCDRQEARCFTSGSRCRRTVDLHHISASCAVKAESAVQLSFSSFRTSGSCWKAAVAAAQANSSATPSRTLPASFPQQQKGAGVRLRNAIPHEPQKEAACQMSPTPEGEKCFIPPFCQNPIPILPSRAPCLTWLHWWKMLKFETATSFQKPFKYRSHLYRMLSPFRRGKRLLKL